MRYLILSLFLVSSLFSNFSDYLNAYYNSKSFQSKVDNLRGLYSINTLQNSDTNSYITQTRVLYLVYRILKSNKSYRCEKRTAIKLFFIYDSLYKLNHPELKEYKRLVAVRKMISNYLKVDIDKVMGSLSLVDNCKIVNRELNKQNKKFMKCLDSKGRCKDIKGIESSDIDSYEISEHYKNCYKNVGTIPLLAKKDGMVISIIKMENNSSLIITPECEKIWVDNTNLK